MKLIARGNRLSVMPVAKEEFDEIEKMGNKK
jgi:predicted RNA-binding protein with PUA-like domain